MKTIPDAKRSWLELEYELKKIAMASEVHSYSMRNGYAKYSSQGFTGRLMDDKKEPHVICKVIPGQYTKDADGVQHFEPKGFTVQCAVCKGSLVFYTDCYFNTAKEAEEAKQAVIDITLIKASTL